MEVWTHHETSRSGADLTGTDIAGYDVEALDGSIGTVDEATSDVGSSYVVVNTRTWILGKKVMLPAGVVHEVDEDEEKVYVSRMKDEIKNAPELDEERLRDESYRDRLSAYYGPGGLGYRDAEDAF